MQKHWQLETRLNSNLSTVGTPWFDQKQQQRDMANLNFPACSLMCWRALLFFQVIQYCMDFYGVKGPLIIYEGQTCLDVVLNVCARACMCVHVRACVRVRMWVYVYAYVCVYVVCC